MEAFRSVYRRDDEAGFTILESVIAFVIIFGTIIVLFRTLDTTTRVVVETRRQAAANALAGELLERARSLEWENAGLAITSNDTDCPDPVPLDGEAGVGCYSAAYDWPTEFGIATDVDGDYTFEGEKVVFANGAGFAPFVHFYELVSRDNTEFERFLFVTQQTDATGVERYRKVTAIVRWIPPSGFRRELRQVTYITRYESPSVPILTGAVTATAGTFEMTGFIQGTTDTIPGLGRYDLMPGTSFILPTLDVRAGTDYVSAATAEADASVINLSWSSGEVESFGGDLIAQHADDDYASAALPSNSTDLGNLLPTDIPVAHSITPNKYIEGGGSADGPTSDSLSYIGLVATTDGKLEGYLYEAPYAAAAMESPGYYSLPMPELPIGTYFIPFLAGYGENGPAASAEGSVERHDVDTSLQVDYSISNQPVHLFFDNIYFNRPGISEKAWITIEYPDVSGDLGSGEGQLPPAYSTSGDVVVSMWDPVAENMVTHGAFDPTAIASNVDIPIFVDFDTDTGTPTTPRLHYVIDGSVTIFPANPATVIYDPSGSGDIIEASAVYPEMVVLAARFFVEDLTTGTILYDYDMVYRGPSMRASAIYVNDATP